MDLDRLRKLVGDNGLEKIKKLNILIVGLGGVGGYTFETLVRCGVESFTIVDADRISETNLNRQIISKLDNIGKYKTQEAKKRALEINSNINIIDMCMFLDKSNVSEIDFSKFDYVVDACDDVNAKKLIIESSLNKDIKVVSSMGTAKKMDATQVYVSTLDKTTYDPLAKKMRKLISKDMQKRVVVVTSKEQPIITEGLGSNSFVPATAGIFITNYIINDCVKID